MALEIAALGAHDRPAWDALARGYKDFYRTPTSAAEFDAAWSRLVAAREIRGLGARLDGRLAGIAHFLFHASTWAPSVCYLQDLFTAPEARGRGVGRALIEAVAQQARAAGAQRCYWLTQQDNHAARALYDKVARFHGFIRYDVAL